MSGDFSLQGTNRENDEVSVSVTCDSLLPRVLGGWGLWTWTLTLAVPCSPQRSPVSHLRSLSLFSTCEVKGLG